MMPFTIPRALPESETETVHPKNVGVKHKSSGVCVCARAVVCVCVLAGALLVCVCVFGQFVVVCLCFAELFILVKRLRQ